MSKSQRQDKKPLTKKQKIVIAVIVVLSVCIATAAIAVPLYWHFASTPKCVGEKEYSYTTTEMHVEHDGINLYGNILVPNGESGQKYPAVIYAHGAGSNWEYEISTLQCLAMSGIVCYAFDFYGWSDKCTGPKNGDWFRGTSFADVAAYQQQVLEQVKDLNAAIEHIKSLEYVDANNVFLLGSSMGGATAATCAITHNADVRGIILQFPATFFMTEPTVDGSAYDVNRYTGKVLVLQGAKDDLVTLSMAQELATHYNKYVEHCRLVVYKNQQHVFDGKYRIVAARDAYKFIKNNLT